MVDINLRQNTGSILRRIGRKLPSSVDIYESPDELLLLVNLPGFDEDGIDVRFVDGQVKIHADRDAGREGYEAISESRPTTVDESVPVPSDDKIDVDSAETGYENGVLSIRLPKVGEPEEDQDEGGPEDEAGEEADDKEEDTEETEETEETEGEGETERGSDKDDEGDDKGEVEHPTSRDELGDMSYRDLQKVAMDLGIKANQKTEVLVEEISDELDL